MPSFGSRGGFSAIVPIHKCTDTPKEVRPPTEDEDDGTAAYEEAERLREHDTRDPQPPVG